ncbi:MAG: hypothetical protein H0V83_02445 [Rubrobacter sp.]|nr:hypothetical protein [Rubrobacter sp.]
MTEPQKSRLDGLPDGLPQTASPKDPVPWWPVILAAVLGILVISLLAVGAWRTLGSHPGGEMNADGVDSVVVSAEESKYLPPDVERFGVRPDAVYVYVVVRRMPSGERLRVKVERERADSVLDSIVSNGGGVVVLRSLETRPGPGENLDVARVALGERSGEALSPGRYEISVYRKSGEQEGEEMVARRIFQIRG